MNSQRLSFLELLAWGNKTQFTIPDWRRSYEWNPPGNGAREVEQLWQDLRANCGIEKKHFYGVILLRSLPSKPGEPAWEVVDGQQRFATFLLLLIALRDVSEKRGTDCSELTGYLTANGSNKGRLVLKEGVHDDRRVMEALLRQDSDKLDEKIRKESRVYLVYRHLLERIEREFPQGMQEFLLSILLGVEFMALTLSTTEDSRRAFEFLMSKGSQIKLEDLAAKLTEELKVKDEQPNEKKAEPLPAKPPAADQDQKLSPKNSKVPLLAVAAGILLCLGLGGAYWAWDHHRTKTTYFRDLASRFGVPEGVGQLSADEIAHRAATFRIEARQDKIRQITEINGDGSPIDDLSLHNACTEVIHYHANGDIERIVFLNHAGQTTFQETYRDLTLDSAGTKHRTVDFEITGKNAPAPVILSLSLQRDDERGAQIAAITRSNITGEVIDYTPEGRIGSVHYRNGNANARSNSGRVWGRQFDYNAAGQGIKTSNLTPDGKPFPDQLGVLAWTRTLDASGNTSEEDFIGTDGKPALSKTGIARTVFKYDPNGNKIEADYFDAKGQPTFNKQGVARLTAAYDDAGNVTEQAYLGTDGKPVYNKEGVARITAAYDKNGHIVEMTCLDANGNLILDKEGTAKLTIAYDERGRIVQQDNFDASGKPAANKAGFARTTFKYDAPGNLVEQANFDTDGKPVLNQDGYAVETFKYDDRGNVTEQTWLGLDGKPVSALAGAARLRIQYDDHNNITSMAYFDVNDHLVLNKEGVAKVASTYDDRNNKIEETYYNEDGEPSLNRAGVARKTLKYDDQGNVIEQMNYDTGGKPVPNLDGTVKLTAKYDDQGNLIEEACFGIDDKPVADKAGIARETMKYDVFGNMIELACFGIDDLPVRDREGVATAKFKHDEKGRKIESAYFGVDGQPTLNIEGIARETLVYDARGNMIEGDFFGTDGQLILSKHGFAKETLKYDEHDRIIEAACFGFDGQPIEVGGASRIVYSYDANGKLLKTDRYDNAGQLVP